MIEEIGGDFFQWLRGFYFVAKNKSVTRACLEMRRNQPTISHQIKRLEKEFGLTLFDRSSGRMELTPEGMVFLENAISIFEIIKEMKRYFDKDQLLQKGNIVIATTYAVIHYFLAQYVAAFNKRYPNVHFDMQGGGLKSILEKLVSAEADFGITNLNDVPETLIYHRLFSTKPVLIAQKRSSYFSETPPPS